MVRLPSIEGDPAFAVDADPRSIKSEQNLIGLLQPLEPTNQPWYVCHAKRHLCYLRCLLLSGRILSG